MSELQTQFRSKIVPKLMKELALANALAVPRLQKVVINSGVGKALGDKSVLENVASTLQRISGQKPVFTKAKKSISNFKIRKGMIIGVKVTLRGKRMYDFLDKLVRITIPSMRDFHGLEVKKGFDGHGNYIMGIREHIFFPEIRSDEVERLHGLEVAVNTSAKSDEDCLALLRALGFPFKKEKS